MSQIHGFPLVVNDASANVTHKLAKFMAEEQTWRNYLTPQRDNGRVKCATANGGRATGAEITPLFADRYAG
jgi:hypothetical protein